MKKTGESLLVLFICLITINANAEKRDSVLQNKKVIDSISTFEKVILATNQILKQLG